MECGKTETEIDINHLFKIYNSNSETKENKEKARTQLILSQKTLAEKAAWKHYRWKNSCDIEDLIQEANLGIIRSIDKFDITRNVAFEYYAYQWADAYVRYAIYSKGRTIRTPIPKIRALSTIKAQTEILREKLGRDPSLEELSYITGYEIKQIQKIISSDIQLCSTSMTTNTNSNNCSTEEFELDIICNLKNPAKQYEQKETYEIIVNLIKSQLTPLEQRVLVFRQGLFGIQKKTLDTIAKDINYTKPGVRIIEIRAINKLKQAYLNLEENKK